MNTDFVPLERSKYGVAISWDRARQEVDLDLQVVVVDSNGCIVDAIYHNNLVAMNGALKHSGDNKAGDANQYGELVWIDAAKLPMRIKVLIFVVAACSGGHLIDVRRGQISVLRPRNETTQVVGQYPMENSYGDVDAVVMMKRSKTDGAWLIGPIDECAEEGESFLDILDVIGKLIKAEIPNAPAEQNGGEVEVQAQAKAKAKASPAGARTGRSMTLPPKAYAVSVRWDQPHTPDSAVDLHGLVIDESGRVTEIVNTGNILGRNGGVCIASSDDTVLQETSHRGLVVDLGLMADTSRLLMFALTIDSDKGLAALKALSVLVLDEDCQKSKARFRVTVEHKPGRSRVLMWMLRHPGGAQNWELTQGNEPGFDAGHILEGKACWAQLLQDLIPEAPKVDHDLLRLDLVPTGVVSLPRSSDFSTVLVTIAWGRQGLRMPGRGINLAALLFDDNHQQVSVAAISQHRECHKPGAEGMVEAGKEGNESLFTQTFTLNLAGIGKKAQQIVLMMTLMGEGTLEGLGAMKCELKTEKGMVASFEMESMPNEPGVVVGRLLRTEVKTPSPKALVSNTSSVMSNTQSMSMSSTVSVTKDGGGGGGSSYSSNGAAGAAGTGETPSAASSPRATTPVRSPRSPRTSKNGGPGSERPKRKAKIAATPAPTLPLPPQPPAFPWTFQTLGVGMAGRHWSDESSTKAIRNILELSIRDVQMPAPLGDASTKGEMTVDFASGDMPKFDSEGPVVEPMAHVPAASKPFLLLASAAVSFELLRTKREGKSGAAAKFARRTLSRANVGGSFLLEGGTESKRLLKRNTLEDIGPPSPTGATVGTTSNPPTLRVAAPSAGAAAASSGAA
eukprot:CAMPEP_0206609848 /NCGR_PEP_ID=MMETSP0325_2-20121206/54090_1 /ASSEMBLY_ACC=CAM_ASM_000347 /TAXON_ID=2866 /ORGANISM="Crypthecodinium cohnii, Strain Seligo" /LENGTH=846 /DNA_ID=CAMNT_0054128331 /DNA_START=105 /DNA_END=2646 /DNA_ORIENTATION=-